ncbi:MULTISPECIES: MFS transporter [unclassified Pseudonocardia]|uniref:MFS transporter n=1 Tax=unclassified Pseudonocardia TaxID=2619320 RepID=UPI001CF62678|nr:MFS transporter [Pseudonocardia sp. ICBG601]
MSQQSSAAAPSAPQAQPKRAALAAWIGSALEYYDFFIYGTAAALVFNKVFFPDSSPATGTLLALATFGVGYLARPLGAFVLGHIGDRFGRKRVLVATVMLMGAATFVIGCLPSYGSIGIAAPIILVAMRLLQGFSAGGEQAGANSMTLEHAPDHQRAYYTSFTLSGTQFGQILATAVFLPIALLPEEDLLSWGWRVPFWLSFVVVLVALFIRRSLHETPVFEQQRQEQGESVSPLVELGRNHLGSVVRVVAAATIATVSTIFTVYALSYAVNTVGLSRSAMLWVGVLANVLALFALPLFARLADRIGRKPVFIGGSIGCAVLMFAYLGAISTGNYVLIFVVGLLMFGIVHSATGGVWPSFYGEMFPARVRLSGTAVGTQIGFAVAGFAPSIAAALAGPDGADWLPVACFVAAICAVNVIAVATGPDHYRTPTSELGTRRSREKVSA